MDIRIEEPQMLDGRVLPVDWVLAAEEFCFYILLPLPERNSFPPRG